MLKRDLGELVNVTEMITDILINTLDYDYTIIESYLVDKMMAKGAGYMHVKSVSSKLGVQMSPLKVLHKINID